MFGKLLQKIFLPKRTRDKLATRPKPARRGGQPQVAAGRDQVLNEALTVYRAQMETYESLDEETRRQIEEDAAKAFGDVLKHKD
ncbi:MAG: hypothetical protein IIC53_07320 [Proteobacteria bacterium]|nr:hypothetical protein [Pseudomonadota bacterium]